MIDKLIDLSGAADLVQSSTMLALGGLTLYRRPMAFVRALLQRHQTTARPTGLSLLAYTAGLESDLLVGAGMVKQVRTCYFGLEIFGLAPMFSYLASQGKIEILEETEASLAFGLRAQMAGVGFMPGRAWVGTDLPRLRKDVKTITDPYSGEVLMAFPAIRPQIAVIHALKADPEGNAVIGDNKGADKELVLTAEKVIITADEIVPELKTADIVAPFVDFVVPAAGGALPTSCHPIYPFDGEEILKYTEQVSDPESFSLYLKTWLHNGSAGQLL